jgi:hypothetical protein
MLLVLLAVTCCLPRLTVRPGGVPLPLAAFVGLYAIDLYRTYVSLVVPSAADMLQAVLVAIGALALLLLPRRTRHWLAPTTLLALSLVAMLLVYQLEVPRPDRNGQVVMLCVVTGAVLLALHEAPLRRPAPALLAALALLTTADWTRVTWDQRYFAPALEDGQAWLESAVGPLDQARGALARSLQAQACRAARVDPPGAGPVRWAGYYDGVPHLQDHAIKLTTHKAILKDPHLREFARQPWRMVSVAPGRDLLPQALADAPAQDGAACLKAGTADATYVIDAAAPQRLVENEIHWPGWTATLICRLHCPAGSTLELQPTSTLGFRTWEVPAGTWEMRVRFVQPHQAPARLVTATGLLLWLALGVLAARGWFASRAEGPRPER